MTCSTRRFSRSIPILAALVAATLLCMQPTPARAMAVWSLQAANNGVPALGGIGFVGNNTITNFNFNTGLNLGPAFQYTLVGSLQERIGAINPLTGTTSSALLVGSFTVRDTGIGPVSDILYFYSDTFNSTAAGLPGWVGIGGAFGTPLRGQVGTAQGQMNFNDVTVGPFGSSFLNTLVVSNAGRPGISPFVALNVGIIPNQVNQLTGAFGFTLQPGQSVTLPFDFSDNFMLTTDLLIPEPSSIVMMALGVIPVGLEIARRAKRRRAA